MPDIVFNAQNYVGIIRQPYLSPPCGETAAPRANVKTRVLFNIMGTAMGKKRKVKHARTFVPVKVERKNKNK